ncbi:recombinase family protein [Alteromonas halophila]|uniref:DNA invertase n=1 Tax=Alteromonas halophila TaxID=516698 RepID=A0A918N086_9ALTE|nr:recombinase family protein [Alteromonas halophila]GGW96661.1 DNA invertase [Alteromonas halophila]
MNQVIGYIRIASSGPNNTFQREALSKEGCHQIFEDVISNKSAAKSQLELCLDALSSGDTLVIWRLDYLSKSLRDLVKLVAVLNAANINLKSLQEKVTISPDSRNSVMQIFSVLAEFEQNLVKEKAQAGLKAARARGRLGGRKSKLDQKDILEIRSLLKDPNLSVADIAKQFGVSRTTIYNRVGVVQPERENFES